MQRSVKHVATGAAAVLGLGWCLALSSAGPAGPAARAATVTSGTHEAPAVYYERLRTEIGRTAPAPASVINGYIARARQAPSIGDFTTGCPTVPPPAATLTSNGFYFLTQILPPGIALDSPTCGKALACFLGKMVAYQANQSNPPSLYSEATLVIDRQCVVNQTLVLPDRFVIAGVGMEGRGVLAFDLPDNAVAMRFATSAATPQRFVAIRDLNIVNMPQCCGQVGLDVSNSSFVTLERVRLHDFGFGVLGTSAFTIIIDKSAIHNNGFNVVIGNGSTSWRIRDTVMNQSGLISVVIGATAIGNVIAGGRIENNPVTGIYLQGPQNMIETSWFEGNGIGFGDHGIEVLASGAQNRITSNLFSSEDILDLGSDTQTCFNTDDNAWVDLNNCPH